MIMPVGKHQGLRASGWRTGERARASAGVGKQEEVGETPVPAPGPSVGDFSLNPGGGQPCSSNQAFSWPAEAHPPWGGLSALLSTDLRVTQKHPE